jgi:hypothetical protein
MSEEYIFLDALVYEMFACAVVKGTELTIKPDVVRASKRKHLCAYVLFVSRNVTDAFANVRPDHKTLILPVID